MDKFLFKYRYTPQSTTGKSPAELMLGRKLRSRLDLLWPWEETQGKVLRQQESQKRCHTLKPWTVSLKVSEPILAKNNSCYGPKWVPGHVVSKTGPLSYRCALPSGQIIKRHQDQLSQRNVPTVGEKLVDSNTEESLIQPNSDF